MDLLRWGDALDFALRAWDRGQAAAEVLEEQRGKTMEGSACVAQSAKKQWGLSSFRAKRGNFWGCRSQATAKILKERA